MSVVRSVSASLSASSPSATTTFFRAYRPPLYFQRSSAPALRPSFFNHSARIRHGVRALPAIQRHVSNGGGAPNPSGPSDPRGRPQGPGVWAPKTRIAIGVVFVGALIYSMVRAL